MMLKRVARLPLWLAELFSGTKSFVANPLIGSRRLNHWGLHVGRVALAHGVMRLRMAMLSWRVPSEDRRQFIEQGFVLKQNYLPEDEYRALVEEVRQGQGEVRQCIQGDARTRRMLLAPEVLEKMPRTRALLRDPVFRRLMRFCAGHLRMPICHAERVMNGVNEAPPDPQTNLHVDTFQPTMKFWLYLEDVSDLNGPFVFVPGSTRLSRERLSWEYRMSQQAREHADRYTARGSFRVEPEVAARLGNAPPQSFKVPGNTLLIANTFGVHARGHAQPGTSRLALWGMSRTNPFIPLPGLGFESLNRLQYRVLQRMRRREDERAAARGAQASWHRVEGRDAWQQ
ncbi:phytanoyl-CoA dioxygenase family protein [Halomonas elongata]|uniref:phytanoyl-CoA dioxygenase family protein n=1 Tax=Halomonas elongata TaxID=2746 RepID=UPI00255A95C5|nr:phytanoyl-CoA dioxygenase family protein [Halomonas elongata]MDL4862177.1 phytanoyl-CoA dioxygenase family protein [Halomonas elongata]